MPKTWIFRETGSRDYPGSGVWMNVHGVPTTNYDDSMMYRKYPTLELQFLDHDPMEPIREVYNKFIPMLDMMKGNPLAISTFPFMEAFMEVWQAVVKSVEGK